MKRKTSDEVTLNIGDIFSCCLFTELYSETEHITRTEQRNGIEVTIADIIVNPKRLKVDSHKSGDGLIYYTYTEEWINENKEKCRFNRNTKVTTLNRDETRSSAKFIVESAQMEGGGNAGMFYSHMVPDALHVEARRLNEDGSYNKNNEIVNFTTNTNNYSTAIDMKDIVVHKHFDIQDLFK